MLPNFRREGGRGKTWSRWEGRAGGVVGRVIGGIMTGDIRK